MNINTLDRRSGLLGAVHVSTQPDGSWTGTLTAGPTGNPATAYRINAMWMSGGDRCLSEWDMSAFVSTATTR